jgi:hypothetical protein
LRDTVYSYFEEEEDDGYIDIEEDHHNQEGNSDIKLTSSEVNEHRHFRHSAKKHNPLRQSGMTASGHHHHNPLFNAQKVNELKKSLRKTKKTLVIARA